MALGLEGHTCYGPPNGCFELARNVPSGPLSPQGKKPQS